jgi:IS5 family transposase
MKAHIGADAASGLVHSVTGTAANVSDISQTHELLHGKEKVVHADAGYIGVEWRVAARRGKIKAMPESWVKDLTLGSRSSKPGHARWWSTRSIS